jgi:hypothetical protein
MINGFVGFQLYEDGTTLSVWLLRVCSIVMFLIGFAVSLLTFKSWGGLGPENTIGIFVVVYIFSALFVAVYIVMQLILVVGTLQERWPLLHIFFGVLAFVMGQVVLYQFSHAICDTAEHYLDALFFSTLANLLAVMMVYKVRFPLLADHTRADLIQYWDSITKEDLEFSVGQRQNNWEVKELLPSDGGVDKRATMYEDSEYSSSIYQQPAVKRTSTYGGY